MVGNLRGIRESGRIFAVPTYFFIVMIIACCRGRRLSLAHRRHRVRSTRRCRRRRGTRHADDVPAADGVLERLHRDDRRRSGVERRAGVPAARSRRTRRRRWSRWPCSRSRCSSASRCSRTSTRSCRATTETVISQLRARVFGGRNVFYYIVQASHNTPFTGSRFHLLDGDSIIHQHRSLTVLPLNHSIALVIIHQQTPADDGCQLDECLPH